MENTYEVNPKRKESAQTIGHILNNCKMLLDLELHKLPNKYLLTVATDEVNGEYTEIKETEMLSFLTELRKFVNNTDDIDELIEELPFVNFNKRVCS